LISWAHLRNSRKCIGIYPPGTVSR
jgi:hypothetical protein